MRIGYTGSFSNAGLAVLTKVVLTNYPRGSPGRHKIALINHLQRYCLADATLALNDRAAHQFYQT